MLTTDVRVRRGAAPTPDLCDGASDLEAFVVVAMTAVRVILVSRQLQLLGVQLHHRLLVHLDVGDQ